MNVASHLDGEQEIPAQVAILIGHQGRRAYATLNPIRVDGDGSAELGAGKPLTRESLIGVWKELVNLPQTRELIPEHLLFADGTRTLWWRPEERRPIFFHTGRKEFDGAMWGKQALYPPLLFLAIPGHLFVWALRGAKRPVAGSHIYRAPFLNIYADGHMCAGTTKLPLEVTPDVKVWERAFFETTFTHSNVQAALTSHPAGHDGLWKALAAEDVGPDWKAWLKPLGKGGPQTVNDVLNLEVRK